MTRLSSCTPEATVISQKGQSGNVSGGMLRKFCANVWASFQHKSTAPHGLRSAVFSFILNVHETLPFFLPQFRLKVSVQEFYNLLPQFLVT